MNVPRRLIGRVAEVTWMDPNTARGPIETLKHGRMALATWREYGVIHDVTEGVVLIAHSYATSPGGREPDEMQHTAIHEDLIENIKVYLEETPDLARAKAAGGENG